MFRPIRMSRQTRVNWLIDAAVFAGATVAILSGIYFLFFTSGGYQGGRNPLYGVTVLFERATWADLHTWGGVVMIVAVIVHFIIHWSWVKSTARRIGRAIFNGGGSLSRGAKLNVAIDLVIALSFVTVAISGLYFLLAVGPRTHGYDPGLFFTRATWETIHRWSGVVLMVAAAVHFYMHWGWVKKVTVRFFLSLLPVTVQQSLQTRVS